MAKEAKTNAMRMLDRQKVKYEAFPYECDSKICRRRRHGFMGSEAGKERGT